MLFYSTKTLCIEQNYSSNPHLSVHCPLTTVHLISASRKSVPLLLLRIYRNHECKRGEGVGSVADVDRVGVGPVEELLRDDRFAVAARVINRVIPLEPVAFNVPAHIVDGESGREEGKFLADAADAVFAYVDLEGWEPGKQPLPDRGDFFVVRVEDLEALAPGHLTLDGEDGVARLVVNVVAVKPRKGSLLEQKLHFYTLLVSPGAMEPISPL